MIFKEKRNSQQLKNTENFINDFILQAADRVFESVKIEEALQSLSQYDIKYDLKPDVIREDLGKIFSVNKTGYKELIVLNEANYEHLKTSSHIDTKGSAKGSGFFDVFSASVSAQYVKDKSADLLFQTP